MISLTRAFVVDASVALKWVIDEETGTETARSYLANNPLMIAPSFWLLECGHALQRIRKIRGLSAEDAIELYSFLQALPVVLMKERDIAADAFALSLALRHAMYDCAYLALARREQLPLVTADVELAKVATAHGLGRLIEIIGPDQP